MDPTELSLPSKMKQDHSAMVESILNRMFTLPQFKDCQPLQVNSRGSFGDTPLHVATIWGDEEAVLALLGAGADVNAVGEHGYTPLHEAVEQGHVNLVKLLISRGASRDIRDNNGLTASALARTLENPNIISEIEGDLA